MAKQTSQADGADGAAPPVEQKPAQIKVGDKTYSPEEAATRLAELEAANQTAEEKGRLQVKQAVDDIEKGRQTGDVDVWARGQRALGQMSEANIQAEIKKFKAAQAAASATNDEGETDETDEGETDDADDNKPKGKTKAAKPAPARKVGAADFDPDMQKFLGITGRRAEAAAEVVVALNEDRLEAALQNDPQIKQYWEHLNEKQRARVYREAKATELVSKAFQEERPLRKDALDAARVAARTFISEMFGDTPKAVAATNGRGKNDVLNLGGSGASQADFTDKDLDEIDLEKPLEGLLESSADDADLHRLVGKLTARVDRDVAQGRRLGRR